MSFWSISFILGDSDSVARSTVRVDTWGYSDRKSPSASATAPAFSPVAEMPGRALLPARSPTGRGSMSSVHLRRIDQPMKSCSGPLSVGMASIREGFVSEGPMSGRFHPSMEPQKSFAFLAPWRTASVWASHASLTGCSGLTSTAWSLATPFACQTVVQNG